ncbi:MAG: gliding motility-associated C-terminal domain-containing protein [Saprospiraceae bacterium]
MQGESYTVTGLSPNESVTITVTANTSNVCGSSVSSPVTCTPADCPVFNIDITPLMPICLNTNNTPVNLEATVSGGVGNGTLAWSGAGVVGNQFDPVVAGAGSHTLVLNYVEGNCTGTQSIVVNVFDTPAANFTVVPNIVCIDTPVTITYTGGASGNSNFSWNFDAGSAMPGTGVGPHIVDWATAGTKTISLSVDENGCISQPFSVNVEVQNPLPQPMISCSPNTTSIVFSWNAVTGAVGYTATVLTAPMGASSVFDETARTLTVSNLVAGAEVTIEVVAIGDGSCGNSTNTFTCQAQDCPAINVSIDEVQPICLMTNTSEITLSATLVGAMGGGTFAWSGDGITNSSSGIFSPILVGAGNANVLVTYSESGCDYTDNAIIVVNETPTASFSVVTPVCTGEASTVVYTGTALVGADYQWNFGGGNAMPGTGAGPHTVSWATGGTKTISLSVNENGCPSQPFTANVEVQNPLPQPVINCSPNTTSIVFSWNAVTGAVGYTATVLTAPMGASSVFDEASRTLTVTNLVAGDEVTIEVVAIGDGPCGNSTNTFTCQAQDCPAITVSIDEVQPICLAANTPVINLSATLTGQMGGGVFTWSGDGITDPMLGTFSPTSAGVGNANVVVTYREAGCDYVDDAVIVINDVPTANFSVVSPVCVGEVSDVVYTGTASIGADYQWNFDAGVALPGNGAGPHQVSWNTSGDKSLSLTVIENGCTSELAMQTVTVEPELIPVIITCEVLTDSIVFSWPAVLGSSSYNVTILDAPANAFATGGDPANTFTMAGFTPGQPATIEVEAISATSCPNITFAQTCALENCPDVTIDIVEVMPICLDGNASAITLSAMLTGNTAGTITWSGAGITDAANGVFDPLVSGPGTFVITATYDEMTCLFTDMTTIVVNPQPTSTFTVESPLCQDSVSTITYTGDAGAQATYNWDFDGGMIVTGTGAGPYSITWPTPGMKTVSLTVTENGCSSTPTSRMVQVDTPLMEPIVTCQSATTSSVTFAWGNVVGASGYNVTVLTGQTGTQNGNTFTVTGLMSGEEVTISLEAISANTCGNVTTTASCTALSCQPLDVALAGPSAVCEGADAVVTLTVTGGQPSTTYTINYTVNGVANQIEGVVNTAEIALADLTAETTIIVTDVADEVNTDCIYTPGSTFTVMISALLSAGLDVDLGAACPDDAAGVNLIASLVDADTGGSWMETSAVLSTGGAFNAATGTFNPVGQLPGTYQFTYTVGGDNCPVDVAVLTYILHPAPIADAGMDQLLSCNMGMVSIGGSSVGATTYEWSAFNPETEIEIADPAAPIIEAGAPGVYTLTVTNEQGCSDTDEMTVSSDFEVPVADVSISPVSCFSASDGAIVINDVVGGTPPYIFSLNGAVPTNNPFFGNLSGDSYTLRITDVNGCFSELLLTLIEPTEVAVQLTTSLEDNGNIIELGQSITLTAQFDPTIVLDTIIWRPDSIAIENQQSITVRPTETTTYTVSITDVNGCTDKDEITIIVAKPRNVFVPTAFSPDGDAVNEWLFPQAGGEVVKIKSFQIYNRWGESVFEKYDFDPNVPENGWDGRHRGEMLNAAVFVYFLEAEFSDGEVILFKGDVILLR